MLAAARRELAIIGQALAAKAISTEADDIFFLHLMELRRRQIPSVVAPSTDPGWTPLFLTAAGGSNDADAITDGDA